jgi:transmembrane sensor
MKLIYTTLVEGKVSIGYNNMKQYLNLNQQSNLNIEENQISVASVNVYNEISWKEGVFSFRKKSLEDIMKVLSRWYDIDVSFENPELKKAGFNGVLGKDQSIEDILEIIKGFGVIKEYELKNRKVVVK